MQSTYTQPNTREQNAQRFGPKCHDSIGEFSSVYQDERIANGYLTLGDLIDFLYTVNHDVPVSTDTGRTLTHPHSYRAYYVDLAFMGSHEPQTALDLLALSLGCLQQQYETWKGTGLIKMNRNTPLWLANRHGDTGRYLSEVSLTSTGSVLITTASEYDEN